MGASLEAWPDDINSNTSKMDHFLLSTLILARNSHFQVAVSSTLQVAQKNPIWVNFSQLFEPFRTNKPTPWNDETFPIQMGVSKTRGTPKWMVYNVKPYENGWYGGVKTHPYFWKHPKSHQMTFSIRSFWVEVTGFTNATRGPCLKRGPPDFRSGFFLRKIFHPRLTLELLPRFQQFPDNLR